jgi:hypothetical protein
MASISRVETDIVRRAGRHVENLSQVAIRPLTGKQLHSEVQPAFDDGCLRGRVYQIPGK